MDLNEHRASVPVSQQLKSSLTQATKPTAELALSYKGGSEQ